MNFKQFFMEGEEEEKNVQALLAKLPEAHRRLLDGFKIKFTSGNVLPGDSSHVGVIDKNKITVAAPFHYGREWVLTHEIGHQIFEKLATPKWKKEWAKVVKKNPKRQKQDNEELWAMAYACHFAKHKIHVHYHPAWENYMDRFCKATG